MAVSSDVSHLWESHSAADLDQLRVWWYFLTGASEYWREGLLSSVGGHDSQVNAATFRNSDHLFRSLVGLRNLIWAVKLWITWSKYRFHCCVSPSITCEGDLLPLIGQIWSGVFMQWASVAVSNDVLSFESLKCSLIYFTQCFSYSVGFLLL